jgi:NAD(P)-dependent dehydrogenase (short-subunit alcohol dehydrogenase family)
MALTLFPDLRGASVFITGGGSGIGAALAEGFVEQGAQVAFADIADATAFADDLAERHGIRPLFLPCDVTDVSALRAAVDEAAEAHGDVTVLINNVADDVRHTTLEVTEDFWNANQGVNLKAGFFATQAVVPGMKRVGGGRIVNLSSVAYKRGHSEYPSYVAAKAAFIGLTRAHARELGPDNIRVNALIPGWTMTEKQRRLWVKPETFGPYFDQQCLKREVVPEDMVPPTLFLASAASTAITGQALAVDGGVVMVG